MRARAAGMLFGAAVAYACGPASGTPPDQATEAKDFHFDATVVDVANSGDCKLAGDLDGDGLPDLVIGGMRAEGLSWYSYPSWRKTLIAYPKQEFTTDCALGDVDGDGDDDIVVPDGEHDNNLKWFGNPMPQADPFDRAQWQELTIGTIGGWGKDVELADLDRDGRLDVAARHRAGAMIFFQNADAGWVVRPLQVSSLGEEGMASGDLDGDGDIDLIVRGAWLENPGGALARSADRWTEHAIGDAPDAFKALVADLDGDGAMDVVFSSSEGSADVRWWRRPESPGGSWRFQTIVEAFERGHTLQAGDMDNDGDLDLVLAQMHTSTAREVLVLENLGRATAWRAHLVDTTGLHNGIVVDIGNDGDLDIFGSNWVGNPPVRLWINRLDPDRGALLLDRWTPVEVSDRSERTFGLGFADVDGDGLDDIVAGRFVHLNPGGDMTEPWARMELPSGMHAFAAAHLTSHGPLEILAQKSDDQLALYALAPGALPSKHWTTRLLGEVPLASHDLGAQGYRLAQLRRGGPPEIILSSGDGLYYFAAPDFDDPLAAWQRVHVSSAPSDEGVAVGDIDGDGNLDLAATTGERRTVEWYRNPGDGGGPWIAFSVGDFAEAVFPDRIETADLNGDGRLDLVVTEENGGEADAETFWWAQPAQAGDRPWRRHLLTVQATTHSLDVADFDDDGDVDIVTGEHRGQLRVVIWENDGKGVFERREVGRGRESHLGTRAHDLDGDGDLDIVSIGYDDEDHVWLWRNDAIDIKGLNVRVAHAALAAPEHRWFSRMREFLARIIN